MRCIAHGVSVKGIGFSKDFYVFVFASFGDRDLTIYIEHINFSLMIFLEKLAIVLGWFITILICISIIILHFNSRMTIIILQHIHPTLQNILRLQPCRWLLRLMNFYPHIILLKIRALLFSTLVYWWVKWSLRCTVFISFYYADICRLRPQSLFDSWKRCVSMLLGLVVNV